MLVLTRRKGEMVAIGRDMAVIVLDRSHGHVVLGFVAPPQVTITRHEVESNAATKALEDGAPGLP